MGRIKNAPRRTQGQKNDYAKDFLYVANREVETKQPEHESKEKESHRQDNPSYNNSQTKRSAQNHESDNIEFSETQGKKNENGFPEIEIQKVSEVFDSLDTTNTKFIYFFQYGDDTDEECDGNIDEGYQMQSVPIRRFFLPQTMLIRRSEKGGKESMHEDNLPSQFNPQKDILEKGVEIFSPQSIHLILSYCFMYKNPTHFAASLASNGLSPLRTEVKNKDNDVGSNSLREYSTWSPPKLNKSIKLSVLSIAEAVSEGIICLSVSNIFSPSVAQSYQIDNLHSNSNASFNTPTVVVTLSLTAFAFFTCTPSKIPKSPPLPRIYKPTDSNRPYHIAKILQSAMGSLFSDSLLEDVSIQSIDNTAIAKKTGTQNVKSLRNSKVTAKMVYEVVDNVNINESSMKSGNIKKDRVSNETLVAPTSCKNELTAGRESIEIEGLLPTLRPYQEEAVNWMMRRENSVEYKGENETVSSKLESSLASNTNNQSEEDRAWELCWIVIILKSTSEMSIVKPLYEFRQSQSDQCAKNKDDFLCFYSPFTGWLSESLEEARNATVWGLGGVLPKEVSGGILADSMGLGKTVEVLACILGHKLQVPLIHNFHCNLKISPLETNSKRTIQSRDDLEDSACICGRNFHFPSSLMWVRCSNCHEPMHGKCAGFESNAQILDETNGGYCDESRCPCCFARKHSRPGSQIRTRATLIICPPSILSQWEREIRTHTSEKLGLKVIVYPGIRDIYSRNYSDVQLVHPLILANADIVLMTFNSLMYELGHSNENPVLSSQRRGLRKRKRYRVIPSPLTSIHWWRICLDEAQKVETPTAASARMALQLAGDHKWCVSGTPLGRGDLEDLYGLLLFIGVSPFRDQSLFRQCFNQNHRGVMGRIAHMLRTIFWRSTKENQHVREQLGIPEQEEKKVLLDFSSIERHFYRLQLEETILASTKATKNSSKTSRSRKKSKKDSDILNVHLHRLRAACCHPQVGSSGIGRIVSKDNSSGVLSMDQILDRLIDDAKTKCEESQRVGILHSNALASLNRLKVEARGRIDLGKFQYPETDKQLLTNGAKIYAESLQLTDHNSKPTNVVGEAVLSGCNGFLQNRKIGRDGKFTLSWRLKMEHIKEVWARIDFEGPAKKITAVKMKTISSRERDTNTNLIFPKDCILQVSSAAVGGEFIDARRFTLNMVDDEFENDDWEVFGDFRTNKSKNWRIVIQNYHEQIHRESSKLKQNNDGAYHISVEVQLMEPFITTDDLQRLHVLNNTVILLNLLDQESRSQMTEPQEKDINKALNSSSNDLDLQSARFEKESQTLETLYMAAAHNLHHESQRRLRAATKARMECEEDSNILTATNIFQKFNANYGQKLEPWWNDLLSWCKIYGSDSHKDDICAIVKRDLFDLLQGSTGTTKRNLDTFPEFESVDGLHAALNLRIEAKSFRSNHRNLSCIDEVRNLSINPSSGEIIENSQCHKCRSDWFQRGPECRHCKLETRLLHFEAGLGDPTIMCILKALSKWCNDMKLSTKHLSERVDVEEHAGVLKSFGERSTKFFVAHVAIKKEIQCAKSAWKTHFDLLSDLDELNQCKRSMRLPYINEDLSKLTEHEIGGIVQPCDISALMMEHSAKQAMAFAELRRNKQTLRFLRNQNLERKRGSALSDIERNHGSKERNDESEATCCVCLSPFGKENTAVLACGHAFHYSPCLEKLISRVGSGALITCPMRCLVRTKRDGIMIASEIRRDDGSSNYIKRSIEGSWGTKVDRLVADIMDVVDLGEKCIVFSQWDDMLIIVEKALVHNHIFCTRAKGGRIFGDSIRKFRGANCSVLLLNVKNGAEGLTLVEATHVFMVEPMLNSGLDMQAINRVHRIGQRCKTFVHRYIVRDTIEEKIDKIRIEKQGQEISDENENDSIYRAGGIDGGFSQHELHEILS